MCFHFVAYLVSRNRYLQGTFTTYTHTGEHDS